MPQHTQKQTRQIPLRKPRQETRKLSPLRLECVLRRKEAERRKLQFKTSPYVQQTRIQKEQHDTQ